MKLLAVVQGLYDVSPGQRYRIEQWEPFLAEKGVEITYAPFETAELREVLYQPGKTAEKIKRVMQSVRQRQKDLQNVRDFDAVYIFREAALLGPAFFERRIYNSGVPIIFDFDDAIFTAYKSPSNGYLSYLKFPKKTATICRLATQVMAGNPYLADYARQYNPAVTIVPSTIDTDKYVVPENRPANDIPIIGWSGSHSTVQHLDTLRETFQQLAKEAKFRLRVVGTPDYKIEGVEVEAVKWRSETEAQDLSSLDIGIMPLPDDQWSKGKCGMKALQYMGLGVPTICSPVGVNSDIISDGKNGFLAATKDEWIAKLKRLLESPELRRELGAAGRRTVEGNYSAKVQAPRVFEIFSAAVNSESTAEIEFETNRINTSGV